MNPSDYPIFLVYSEEDHAWLARVDQLPGCVVDGATPEEALFNSRKAVEVWIETANELKRQVPAPLSADRIEFLQAQTVAKQQELFQAAVQKVVDEVLTQFQNSKLHQINAYSSPYAIRVAGAVTPDYSRHLAKAG